jgi:hypothetical protein
LRSGAPCRQTVVGGRLPIDFVPVYRRPSSHYPLLPTRYCGESCSFLQFLAERECFEPVGVNLHEACGLQQGADLATAERFQAATCNGVTGAGRRAPGRDPMGSVR